MEVQAYAKQVRISPRKVRLVADSIRMLSIADALNALKLVEKRAGAVLEKTLKSALANATTNAKLDKNSLKIRGIEITDGPALRRYHASTRGRIHPYKRRSSNIRIILEEVPNGTKS